MTEQNAAASGWLNRALNGIERVGNKLPDPAILFAIFMVGVWLISAWMSTMTFAEVDPRTQQPIVVQNMLSGAALTAFMANLVNTFVTFPPLGVVLVAMLGLGVAEYTGFINAGLRAILSVTPRMLLTPVLIAVGILSHVAVDAGYVLVIPLGAVIFYAAGRHPLAGIAAAFAGVSGGFSATLFIPSSLDPMLAGLTQAAAHLSAEPGAAELVINPLNNIIFTSASTVLIIAIGWALTDLLIEPRLRNKVIDGDPAELPTMSPLTDQERKGLLWSGLAMLISVALLVFSIVPMDSAWRAADGEIAAAGAPLMRSIVALIFVFFLIPGVVYGYIAGTVKTHRDVVKGMSKSMSGMGYYIVMAFFCAQFIYAFGQSNLGALIAIKGANALKELAMPMGMTLIGIVFLTAFVNLLVGSASAKWALIGSVMVPMLMQLGVSPDLTQAAYRVGDSSTNIITPLMPYFPLIVVFCQKYVKDTGIGSLVALMLPFTVALLTLWTLFLIGFWWLDIPLGIGSHYSFPAVNG
ncbi:AbgT family transporter [Permianibacter aggregans]|uniref:Para-aminobenzoyl-glutamate transporter family n=1 Tax=Permianibacter aggregans TaxID=1510150 RepID=A0A4R6UGL5_9GAMM|nr:AbgT family transporter [Permianibacter aggregans]QGX39844.1 AbgT family transporter [Permianibacter aggregans]TDQ45938.1 para-aminobenzoyl-glutamate transporter family [Permianibacter aggregans]